MPWVKLDDSFYEHGKFRGLTDRQLALWVKALAWANRNVTDGLVDVSGMKALGYTARDAAVLVARGLWEPVPEGWLIHDFHDYQPSAADVRAQRRDVSEAKRAAGRKGAAARWQTDAKRNAKRDAFAMAPSPVPVLPDYKSQLQTVVVGEPVDKLPIGEIQNIVSIARSEAS